MRIAVIIPIYKDTPLPNELISIKQALNLLRKYNVTFITYKELDIQFYIKLCKEYNVKCGIQYFPKQYFTSIEGYNRLLLEKHFYQRFNNYQFILIYQTDAFVFKDELSEWCNKGYDYIGAPLLLKRKNKIIFEGVGNGGFSLRKTASFIKVLECQKRIVKSPKRIFFEYFKAHGFSEIYKKLHLVLLRSLGYKNSSSFYIDENIKKEDIFWGLIAPLITKDFKVAPVNEAIKFSFESEPQWCFLQNNRKLPFGCHAWYKYDQEFWNPFIKTSDIKF